MRNQNGVVGFGCHANQRVFRSSCDAVPKSNDEVSLSLEKNTDGIRYAFIKEESELKARGPLAAFS